MGVTGIGCAGRDCGARAAALAAADLLMISVARAGLVGASDSFGAAADCTTSGGGAAPVG